LQPERRGHVEGPRGRSLSLLLVLVGLAIRLVLLGNEPLDGHHVRQADTASIARVMARDTLTLWTPRIGWAGPEAGPVEAEFPLYPVAVAIAWRALPGEPPWAARLLSVVAWLLATVGLARLASRRLPDLPLVLPLGLFVLSPLSVLFSRSIQPEMTSVALLVWAWERADASNDGVRPGSVLLLSAGLFAAACAISAPVIAWLPALAYAGWAGLERIKGRDTLVVLAVAVLPPIVWGLHAHELGVDGATLGSWGFGSGAWSTLPSLLEPANWRAIARGLVGTGLTPLGAVLMLGAVPGLATGVGGRGAAAGLLCGVAAIACLVPTFAAHEYTLLPLLPFASVLAGIGAAGLWGAAVVRGTPASRLVGAAAAVGLVVVSAWQGGAYLSWGFHTDERIASIADGARAVLPPGTAVVVVDKHPQSLLYALDQTGWHRQGVTLDDVRALRGWGATAMLITDTSASWGDEEFVRALLTRHPLVARGTGWSLVRLDISQGGG
jgi:hypothetical protein